MPWPRRLLLGTERGTEPHLLDLHLFPPAVPAVDWSAPRGAAANGLRMDWWAHLHQHRLVETVATTQPAQSALTRAAAQGVQQASR
jgi:outer membrane protein TolC